MDYYPRCLSGPRDLEQFGIELLTGEADNLGFRTLCDLTAQGRRLVAETYGISEDGFAPNWNCGDERDPHVASFMLSDWRAIGVVALISTGSDLVVEVDRNALFGLRRGDYESAGCDWDCKLDKPVTRRPARLRIAGQMVDWPGCYGVPQRVYAPLSGHPHVGTRNVHAMTGRSL